MNAPISAVESASWPAPPDDTETAPGSMDETIRDTIFSMSEAVDTPETGTPYIVTAGSSSRSPAEAAPELYIAESAAALFKSAVTVISAVSRPAGKAGGSEISIAARANDAAAEFNAPITAK